MANTIDTGGGGGGQADPVEFVQLTGGPTITIAGASFSGVTEAEQSGGVNAPTKRTEEGYDYTTRVNREARTASFSGWVTSQQLSGLRYRSLNEDAVNVTIDEEQSADKETRHTTEVIGYVVIADEGLIYAK